LDVVSPKRPIGKNRWLAHQKKKFLFFPHFVKLAYPKRALGSTISLHRLRPLTGKFNLYKIAKKPTVFETQIRPH
jgi:hypothetical protein